MGESNSATSFEGPMDPTDIVDYVSEFGPLLETSETIQAGFTVSPTTEAAALGFEINSSVPPSLEVGNQNILFWSQVNVANRDDDVWSEDGVQVPVEITFTTNVTPRQYQRTFLITVKQL